VLPVAVRMEQGSASRGRCRRRRRHPVSARSGWCGTSPRRHRPRRPARRAL
jgi:hypothetical protein